MSSLVEGYRNELASFTPAHDAYADNQGRLFFQVKQDIVPPVSRLYCPMKSCVRAHHNGLPSHLHLWVAPALVYHCWTPSTRRCPHLKLRNTLKVYTKASAMEPYSATGLGAERYVGLLPKSTQHGLGSRGCFVPVTDILQLYVYESDLCLRRYHAVRSG